MENRIINLEKKFAFSEHMMEQINEMVILQQKQIQALDAKIKMIDHKVLNELFLRDQQDEPPPPHY